jgi:hypothetical protein
MQRLYYNGLQRLYYNGRVLKIKSLIAKIRLLKVRNGAIFPGV